MPANNAGPDSETEKELQAKILRVAKEFGWQRNHVFRAKLEDGTWRTTCAPGWPDLTLAHPMWGRLLILEVKGPNGRLTPDQKRWLVTFQQVAANCPGFVHAYAVAPRDWPAVQRLLTRRAP